MMKPCFLCGAEAHWQNQYSVMPKELLDKDVYGNLSPQNEVFCNDCLNFKKNVDVNFTELCRYTRVWEWYRSESKKQGEFFPATFVYNVDLDKIRALYWDVFNLCLEAHKIASDEKIRQENKDNFNYYWRKRDV